MSYIYVKVERVCENNEDHADRYCAACSTCHECLEENEELDGVLINTLKKKIESLTHEWIPTKDVDFEWGMYWVKSDGKVWASPEWLSSSYIKQYHLTKITHVMKLTKPEA